MLGVLGWCPLMLPLSGSLTSRGGSQGSGSFSTCTISRGSLEQLKIQACDLNQIDVQGLSDFPAQETYNSPQTTTCANACRVYHHMWPSRGWNGVDQSRVTLATLESSTTWNHATRSSRPTGLPLNSQSLLPEIREGNSNQYEYMVGQ